MSSNADALDVLRNAEVVLPEPIPVDQCLASLQRECTAFKKCGPVIVNESSVQEKLEEEGMNFCDAAADGNCWFRACSQALYGTEDHHAELRTALCSHLLKQLDEMDDGDNGFLDEDEHIQWGLMSIAEARNSILQHAKCGISVDGDKYILESCHLWKINAHLWQFDDVTMTLQDYLSVNDGSGTWRRWDMFHHMTHWRGWSPSVGERVFKYENGRWLLAKVRSIVRTSHENTFTVTREVNDASTNEDHGASTETVSIDYLHKVYTNSQKGQHGLSRSGHHFSSLLPKTSSLLPETPEPERTSAAQVLLRRVQCPSRITIAEITEELKRRSKQPAGPRKQQLLDQVRCLCADTSNCLNCTFYHHYLVSVVRSFT